MARRNEGRQEGNTSVLSDCEGGKKKEIFFKVWEPNENSREVGRQREAKRTSFIIIIRAGKK